MSHNLDVISRLEEHLESHPLDMPKWDKLLTTVKTKDKEEQVRKLYERYLELFRMDGHQWCNYINYELTRGEFSRVEDLFKRCLNQVASVEVLCLYVLYVRRVNDVITGGEKARRVVISAFEFAVKSVGVDLHLGELWQEFIKFLQLWTPAALWEQQQKIDHIRKVYRRALAVPTLAIEQIWMQYLKWENEVNGGTASKFINDRLAEYMTARLWKTEWQHITGDHVERRLIPHLLHSEKNYQIKAQLDLWKRWVEFERKNTLDIKDSVVLNHRIEYCLRQATQALVFAPQTWFHYAKYYSSLNDDLRAKQILVDGVKLNPRLMVLSFQLAEAYETDDSFELAKLVYEKLIAPGTAEYGDVTNEVAAIEAKMKPLEDGEPPKTLSRDERDELRKLQARHLRVSRDQTLIWTKYMTATKRALGIKEARQVFKQGRKDFEDIGPEFYIANALLEHYNDNPKVANKVFELGVKQFPVNGKFMMGYMKYLIQTNDVDNIRKLIQLADLALSKDITQMQDLLTAPEVLKDVVEVTSKLIDERKRWLKRLLREYIRYAHQYLLMDVADSFITKYEQLFPDDDSIDLFSDRYRELGVNVIKEDELDSEDDDDEAPAKRRKVVKETAAPKRKRGSDKDAPNLPPPPRGLSAARTEEEPEDTFVKPSVVKVLRLLPNSSYFRPTYNSKLLVQMVANLPNVNTK